MTDNKQQTAVDWLIEKIYMTDIETYNFMKENGDFEQAKEMEKEEIETAFNVGFKDSGLSYLIGEIYYNETYGGNK